jgi:hypothetical protein
MNHEPVITVAESPPLPPDRFGRWATAGVVVGLMLLVGFGVLWPLWPVDCPRPAAPAHGERAAPAALTVQPVDLAAVRARAWEKILPRLAEADAAATAEIDHSLERLHRFFGERKAGTRAFADAVLSLRGKWRFVKARLPWTDDEGHFTFLRERFAQHVFRPDDLKVEMEASVARFASAVQGIENQLLVKVRADLSDSELRAVPDAVPALRGAVVFQQEYAGMLNRVVPVVAGDVNVGLAKELSTFLGAEVAARLSSRVAVAVGTRLGISAGLLTAGAASGWATFGVGLVAAIVLDISIDWLMKLSGYDPAGEVAAKVNQTLDRVRLMIVRGDPEAHAAYKKLRDLEQRDPVASVRAECGQSADHIAASGNLGLRFELERLNEVRAKLRREALRRLVLEGGGT